jgi:chorismate--pyruvate lyase
LKKHALQLEPNWAEWSRLRHSGVPGEVQHWLRDRGSLTARLKTASRGGFSVRLLGQSWGRPLCSERELLGMRAGEIAVIREVELLSHDTPWVFARTLIPAGSLKGAARRLTMLGTRPLGEVLFADPGMLRGVTEMARITARHGLFASATRDLDGQIDAIWGRRTLFRLSGQPLLVNEIFLPELFKRER